MWILIVFIAIGMCPESQETLPLHSHFLSISLKYILFNFCFALTHTVAPKLCQFFHDSLILLTVPEPCVANRRPPSVKLPDSQVQKKSCFPFLCFCRI